MKRLFISAAHKSSGKTTISIGLCAALTARDIKIQPFKKGPDFIDPMWLSMASGRSCYNLDFYTQTEDEIRNYVGYYGDLADLSLIEGNKGLFDGVALDGSNSNAALAKLTRTPVVLVIDTRGMTRGIAPLLLGYQGFDTDIEIAGVILNQVGGDRHEQKLRAAIKHYTDIPVVGAVRRDPGMQIDERHLGLVPSNEAESADSVIESIGKHIAEQIDLDLLMGLAANDDMSYQPPFASERSADRVRIAIARDAAFGFYYPDDLEAMDRAGADLVPFDATRDRQLPEVDGLFIGGGFPESCMEELEANRELRADIRAKLAAGLPCYAECGGLMYLSQSMQWKDRTAEMVGAVPGKITMHRRPQGRGYIRIRPTRAHPWLGQQDAPVYGHEFHHSRLEQLPADSEFAYQVERGTGINGVSDGYVKGNLLAGYAHLRNTSRSPWVQAFVDFVRQAKKP